MRHLDCALYMRAFVLPVFTRSQNDRLGSSDAILNRAVREGYVEPAWAVASSPTPLILPTFNFCPGADVTEHIDAWAYAVQSRPVNPPREIEFFHFTERGCNLVGAPPVDLSKPFQISHALQIPEIFIATYAIEPALCEGWVGDRFLKRRHPRALKGYSPDIAVLSPGGRIKRVIDYAGPSYDAARLRRMVEVCASEGVALEVW